MDDGQSMFGWKFSKEPMLHSLTWLLGCMSLSVLGPIIGIKLLYKVFSGIINQHRYGKAQFNGKVVVITGASSGLGAALSHHLYSKGCRLILASRNITALNELKKTLINTYDLPHLHIPTVIHLDLETLDDIPNVVSKIFDTHHHVDVLINNAGMSYRGEIMQTDASVHLKLMLVNYLGQVVLTKGILTKMIARRSGHVIGVSSVQGKVAIPFRSSYSASKHAFQSFMDTLRSEVAKDNIDVTTISPGYINTNLSLNAVTGSGTNYGGLLATSTRPRSLYLHCHNSTQNTIHLSPVDMPKPPQSLLSQHSKEVDLRSVHRWLDTFTSVRYGMYESILAVEVTVLVEELVVWVTGFKHSSNG